MVFLRWHSMVHDSDMLRKCTWIFDLLFFYLFLSVSHMKARRKTTGTQRQEEEEEGKKI
jgi:preprotein translocase subunit SecG